jgi:hypothetical protein
MAEENTLISKAIFKSYSAKKSIFIWKVFLRVLFFRKITRVGLEIDSGIVVGKSKKITGDIDGVGV